MLLDMQDKKIVRVNVEVIYDDGTLEELKAPEADGTWLATIKNKAGYRVLDVMDAGFVYCEPR